MSEMKTSVNFQLWISVNRLSNNWAQNSNNQYAF